MPHRPRIHLARLPLHIVQPGINREPCFFAEEDYCHRTLTCSALPRLALGHVSQR
jgi:putative transposase